MILTCPQCQTRFLVPSATMPDEGRKVRCSQCSHIWTQMPVENDLDINSPPKKFEKQIETENINDRTPARKSVDTSAVDVEKETSVPLIKKVSGFGGKAFIAGILIVLIPFMAVRLFTPDLIVGYGLVFHDVQIERDGQGLAIYGEVVNTMDDERGVPPIRVTMVHSGVSGDSVIFTLDRDVLPGGARSPIAYIIPDIDVDVTDLKIGFDLVDDNSDADNSDNKGMPTDIPSSSHP